MQRLAVALVLVLALAARADEKPTPAEEAAKQRLEQALALHQKAKGLTDAAERTRQYEQAIALLRENVKALPDTRWHGMSQFNIGVFLTDQLGRHDEGAKEFTALIASKVDDRDPTGYLMSPFRNYRYQAWRMISTCHEKQGRRGLALEACWRMKAAYATHCGTCQQQMEAGFVKRVDALLARLLLEGEGKVATDADRAAFAELASAARRSAPGADGLLLALGRAYRERQKNWEARVLFKALADDLPASPHAAEARKALEELR